MDEVLQETGLQIFSWNWNEPFDLNRVHVNDDNQSNENLPVLWLFVWNGKWIGSFTFVAVKCFSIVKAIEFYLITSTICRKKLSICLFWTISDLRIYLDTALRPTTCSQDQLRRKRQDVILL